MAVESDYFVVANTAVPRLAKMFVGQKYTGNSPDLNPLYRDLEDVKELSPQLIIAGGAEFALGDAKSWATTCAKAEVIHELVIGWGQLHVWALGSDFIDPSLREATDQKIIGWMLDSRRPGVWPSQP
jgi:acetyl esterase/lipase